MIKEFKELETRDSAVIYKSTWEQIKMLYAQDKEKAGELAISAIEMMLTGEVSTDDFMIRLVLKDMEVVSVRNKDKHEKKVEASRAARIEKLKLDTIAVMLLEGKTQVSIAAALGESKQTISNRVKVLRTEFPELLAREEVEESQKSQISQTYVNDNDNDNDNDNVTSPSARGGVNPTPQCSAALPPALQEPEVKKEFKF